MKFVPFAVPDITSAERLAVDEVLKSLWITTGPKVKQFESAFARAVGAKHAVAVNSCTAALHLALEALGISRGDEVVVPTLTFAATAEVVRYLGATPVLVDVRREDHNMDPSAFEDAITKKTKAVIPVHFGGEACDMKSIEEIARKRSLHIVEDAAHAFPAAYKGRTIGSIGRVTCFSFYATKTITTGEGGMAVTDDAALEERMRIMSLHGISKDAWKRYTAEGSWYYEIDAPGFKYNMTDIAAAMGVVQLGRANEMLEKRRKVALRYEEAFSSLEGIELPFVRDAKENARHLFVIRLKNGALKINRNQFIDELKELGIGSSVHFIPLHLHPYYRDTLGYAPGCLPVAEDVYSCSISLPIYSKMTDDDVERVISAVLKVHGNQLR
jgi:dTDP-4-amino-4,6-dideoxygalactose transaminase